MERLAAAKHGVVLLLEVARQRGPVGSRGAEAMVTRFAVGEHPSRVGPPASHEARTRRAAYGCKDEGREGKNKKKKKLNK